MPACIALRYGTLVSCLEFLQVLCEPLIVVDKGVSVRVVRLAEAAGRLEGDDLP
jgi:hypothetical protein